MSSQTILTTCSYCSVGCNFDAQLSGGHFDREAKGAFLPSKGYPVNLGKSCPKGFNLLAAFDAEDRLTDPMIRRSDGTLEPVSWQAAIDRFCTEFKAIKEAHGPESVAFISTGQIPFEEMAFLGALFKFGMGFLHADGNTRQCMATAAVAYKQAFGFDAPGFTYKDLEESDLMIFIGANPVIAHPVIWNRVKMNRKDAVIVTIDPRRTKTAEQSAIHLAIEPKTDIVLLYAMIRELIERDWIDHGFIERSTEGFDELREHVTPFTLERTERETGIDRAMILDLVERIHRAEATSIYWTMGVNQSHQGVRTAQAIINLCLITGNIGKPGAGPNSITGQANAMGSRLYSNTTGMFSLYNFESADDRAAMARILEIPEEVIPAKNGLPYHRIIEEIDAGRIKGLWIIATNPMHSWINKNAAEAALRKLDFLVVQDLYHTTDTARYADLLLAAAGSGEKEGTFINSERRLGAVRKILDPPGNAKTDFDIFRMIADRWGCGELLSEWSSPEAVFRILQRTSRGRPCDITGIEGYKMIDERGGVQWPYPRRDGTPLPAGAGDQPERALYGDGRFFTPSGKARLLVDPVAEPPEHPDEEYPFLLLTGRGSVAQWHTQTRTEKVAMLRRLYPERLPVQINPSDAERLAITDGDRLKVASRRGDATAFASVTDEVQAGHLFMPMHYYDTNLLTFPVFDPYSHQPGYKYAAVKIGTASEEEHK